MMGDNQNSRPERMLDAGQPQAELDPAAGTGRVDRLFQPMHLLVLVGVALLVFGPKKLPELSKGLGESIRGFKAAVGVKLLENTPLIFVRL